MAAKVGGKAFVYGVAAVTLGCRMDYRAFGDDGDVGRSSADIDDCRSTFICRQNARAECSGEALFHHKNLADMCLFGGV